MHVIVDVDAFPPTAADTLEILMGKNDPRVQRTEANDMTDTILGLHAAIKGTRVTLSQYIAALYLKHGLDYLENVPSESKRKNKQAWPGIVQGHDLGSDAALIFPFSTRACISTMTLATCLQAVRASKKMPYTSSIEPVFDAAYIIGAYSGVLHPAAVESQYNGNSYAAMGAVVDGIRQEFARKRNVLHGALSSARNGELVFLDEFEGRWGFVQDVLKNAVETHDEP